MHSARFWTFQARLTLGVILFAVLVPALPSNDEEPADALLVSVGRPVTFENDIVPIFRAYCWKCHGAEGLEAGLDLRTLPLIRAGGKSGPAIADGSASQSRIYQKVIQGEMPPGAGHKPTAVHQALLRDWLNAGAPAAYVGDTINPRTLSDSEREWWAFQPPRRTPTPAPTDSSLPRNPIDAWLLAKLEARGLTFSPAAERAAWLRRVSLDLCGLPPQPAEQVEFVADDRPDAAERALDRLLASPHYGERWGRHWLDAAGYVDTIGSDNDAGIIEERERIWKYRDWVIRAVNADVPYDRFLLEQIAGDELFDWQSAASYDAAALDLLTATGFLRQAADVTYAPELNTADIRHQVLYDTVQILSGNVLGLTLHCAQCHDHKFDPISQAEYYQFLAFFASAYDPQHWKHSKDRHLFDVPPREQAAIDEHNKQLDWQINERKDDIAAAREPFAQKLRDAKLAALPEETRTSALTAVQTPPEKRTPEQKELADKFGPQITVAAVEIDAVVDEATKSSTAQKTQEIQQLSSQKKSYGKLQSLWNVSRPKMYLYRRGDYQTPGAEVQAGVPQVLCGATSPVEYDPSVGMRARLARWLTRSDHPLTARVFANRVWQQCFGRGIVATSDNFGASGAQPSHPELLDWLALEFVRSEWSLKQLQRKILASAAYRQSSQTEANSAALHRRTEADDPENLLLWRMPLRRLESEIVRDSMLAASGSLDETLYGPPLPLKPQPDGRVEIDQAKLPPGTSPFRRSVYLFSRRNYQLTELSVFDQPVVSHNCTRRNSTAVVLQSLTLLNGTFAFEQAERMSAAVRAATADDPAARIEQAYQFTFNRRPDPSELSAATAYLQRQTERLRSELPADQAETTAFDHLCQMLLNASEFLYVP